MTGSWPRGPPSPRKKSVLMGALPRAGAVWYGPATTAGPEPSRMPSRASWRCVQPPALPAPCTGSCLQALMSRGRCPRPLGVSGRGFFALAPGAVPDHLCSRPSGRPRFSQGLTLPSPRLLRLLPGSAWLSATPWPSLPHAPQCKQFFRLLSGPVSLEAWG